MTNYATSWNVQVESSAKWEKDAGAAIRCAALDDDAELGCTGDAAGGIQLWRWPLADHRDPSKADPCRRLGRQRTPGGVAPFALHAVPRRRAFLAVLADDDAKEVHAYVADDTGDALAHHPLLALDAIPTATCVHGALAEIVVAGGGKVRCYAARPPASANVYFSRGDVRLPACGVAYAFVPHAGAASL